MSQQGNNGKRNTPIKDVKNFIKKYMESESGKRSLNRKPHRKKDENGKVISVWQSPAMAIALRNAANK